MKGFLKMVSTPQVTHNLINTLPNKFKPIASFIAMNESDSAFAHVRMVQETAVNWAPKAIFSRSIADFTEMTFLEFAENFLVYYGPKILGENVFRKIFSKKLNPELKKSVSIPLEKLLKDKSVNSEDVKSVKPVKAAIAVAGLAIPLSEFSLSYVKNLLTIKVFKQADFNNIANLNKVKNENEEKQKAVKQSAKNHIKLAAGIFAGCLGLASLLAFKGRNSKVLNYISDFVLVPGNKIFKNDAQKAETFNKYFSLDFSDANGKLGLSKGQVTACVIAALFGYSGAAKDRGKQNLLEVLFRLPLVGFYAITGSEMFEKGFKAILKKSGGYKEIMDNGVPKLSDLSELAEKLALKNGTTMEAEFHKLFKQKAVITSVPFLFSIGFMGMFVAGMSRFFTQYRYNKEMEKNKQNIQFGQKGVDEFKKRLIK